MLAAEQLVECAMVLYAPFVIVPGSRVDLEGPIAVKFYHEASEEASLDLIGFLITLSAGGKNTTVPGVFNEVGVAEPNKQQKMVFLVAEKVPVNVKSDLDRQIQEMGHVWGMMVTTLSIAVQAFKTDAQHLAWRENSLSHIGAAGAKPAVLLLATVQVYHREFSIH